MKTTRKNKEKKLIEPLKESAQKEKFIEEAIKDYQKLHQEILPFLRKEDLILENTRGEWIECSLI